MTKKMLIYIPQRFLKSSKKSKNPGNARAFYKKNFYKKMSLKNPKTLRKC